MKPIKPSERSNSQQGQGLVDYALIIVIVALVVIGAMILFGDQISAVFCRVSGELGGGLCDVQSESYCEDAFKNNKGWSFTRSGEDSWDISGGSMCMTKNTYKDYAFNTCSQDLPSEDYIIRLDGAELTQGSGYGVFFRLQEPSVDPSGYTFQYDPGAGGFVFRKWTNGSESTLRYKRATDYDFYNIPRDIEIHVKGSTFEAYIDGELMLTATDSTYPAGNGGVGMRTWGNTRTCFSDLKIDPMTGD